MWTVNLNKKKVSDYIFDIDINDLDLLHFFKSNIDTDLILHDFNEFDLTYSVKENEKGKTYILPISLFLQDDEEVELNENCNSKQNQNNIIQKTFCEHKSDIIKYWLILFLFSYILIKSWDYSSADILTNEDDNWQLKNEPVQNEKKIKTEFELLAEKINNNSNNISKQLEIQKNIRDEIKKLEKQVFRSIEKVKNFEKENLNIKNNLIELSQ